MRNFISICLVLLCVCCKEEKQRGEERARSYLALKTYVADHTVSDTIKLLLPQLNQIAKQFTHLYFVDEDGYDAADSNQILLIPFRKKNEIGVSSGYSDIGHRIVFICPPQINEFVRSNSFSDTFSISGYLGIILLHEIGHFITKIPGSFDECDDSTFDTSQKYNKDPIYMTSIKKKELKVDSVAIEMVKTGLKSSDAFCFNSCMDMQLAIVNAEFMLKTKRNLENFGHFQDYNPYLLKDKTWTHPNLELRIAFMSYYLNPSEEKLSQLNEYLFQREIAPLIKYPLVPDIYHKMNNGKSLY